MADGFETGSDVDFSEDEAMDSSIGGRAMTAIRKKSAMGGINSEEFFQNLQDRSCAPGTVIARKYWLALFDEFAKCSLDIDLRENTTPNGKDIVRFLSQLPEYLQSKHDDGKLAWTVVKDAEYYVKRGLVWRHEDFHLSKREQMQLDATIETLLDEKIITKDPVREALWLTCQMVKRMSMAVFSDAILNGTKSWDVTVAGCLGLVMQSALASRAGDFKRSSKYKGTEYLKWNDIHLVAKGSSVTDVSLVMQVTLYYRKGHKNDPANALKMQFGQLEEQHNTIDVTKLLVAYALRIGLVAETTWNELITTVLRRPSKRFVWTRPDSPVFFAWTKGERLDFNNPAPAGQQTRFLRRASSLLGMMALPISHDLRRGAAADISSLEPMSNQEEVRKSLGHSHAAAARGTTERYVGRLKKDTWTARIDSAANAPEDPFDIQMAPTRFVKRKIATRDIENYCTTNELDPGDRNSRHRARMALEKIQFNHWRAEQQSIMDDPRTQPETTAVTTTQIESRVPAPINLARTRVPLRDITNLQRLPVTEADALDDGNNTNGGIDESSVDAMATILGLNNADHNSNPSAATVDSMSHDYLSMLASSQPSEQPSIFTSPISDFIGYLSTINEISIKNPGIPDDAETGGSRLAPSKFVYACRKEGCPRSFHSALRRDQHEVNCQGAVLDDPDDEESVPIDENQQQLAPQGRKRKRQDISVVHDGFPKPCPDSDICGVTKDFATKHLMNNHRTLHHSENWPKETACNVPGCHLPRDHYFVSREAFRRHLSTTHFFDNATALEYISKIIDVAFVAPRGTSASYLTTMCLFPDCNTTAEFGNYSDYTGHLKKKHNQTPEQYPQYMPTAQTVRLHPRPDVTTIDILSPVAQEFDEGPCDYPQCPDDTTIYTDEPALVRHLNALHGVPRSEASKYFSGPEIAPFYGTRCLHADCSAKIRFFFDEKLYKAHLKRSHNLTTVAEISSVQLWYKLKYGTTGEGSEQEELAS